MARTSTKTQAKAQSQNTNGTELSRRRRMAINSLRKRGVQFPEGFEDLHILVSIVESAYYRHGNGTLSTEEASKAIDDTLKRHQEGYDPLNNPNLL